MSSVGLQQFKLDVTDAAARAGLDFVDLERAVALQALRNLVLGTRVDTGRARGNWQVTVDEPAEGYVEERKDKSGGPTIAAGAAVLDAVVIPHTIWIHNGVPYIGYLEDLDKMLEGTYQALLTYLMTLGLDE